MSAGRGGCGLCFGGVAVEKKSLRKAIFLLLKGKGNEILAPKAPLTLSLPVRLACVQSIESWVGGGREKY